VLIRIFYIGLTSWNRHIPDSIVGGDFIRSYTIDSYKIIEDLVGSPPLEKNLPPPQGDTKILERLEEINKGMPSLGKT
jgi:hypothetical protein